MDSRLRGNDGVPSNDGFVAHAGMTALPSNDGFVAHAGMTGFVVARAAMTIASFPRK